MKPLILALVVVGWRTSARRCDLQPEREAPFGFLAGLVEMHFFSERVQNAVAFLRANDHGIHAVFISKAVSMRKRISEWCGAGATK